MMSRHQCLNRRFLFSTLGVVTLLLFATGCPRPNASNAPANGEPSAKPQAAAIRLLVIDDRPLGDAIAQQWRSRTESEIDLQHVTAAELAEARRLPADVVIFPSGMLGQLTEHGLIVPLASDALSNKEFAAREIFDGIRLAETRWGHNAAAIPLGSPQLLLAYRADLFEQLELQPPATWQDYQELAAKLADRSLLGSFAPAEDAPWQAASEPLASGWAGQTLLARAAAYVTHRDQVAPLFNPETMQPLIDQAPFARALDELAASQSMDQARRLTPSEAVNEVLQNRAAMAIGWPVTGELAIKQSSANPVTDLRFVPLPGSPAVFNFALSDWEDRQSDEDIGASLLGISGRQAAVSSSANSPEAALNFLLWLGGSESSVPISRASSASAPFREKQLAQASNWIGFEGAIANSYGRALQQSLSRKQVLLVPRIPGRDEYLTALDEAVFAVLEQKSTSTAALRQTADRWQEITEKRGREKQRLAYRRSLGVADWP